MAAAPRERHAAQFRLTVLSDVSVTEWRTVTIVPQTPLGRRYSLMLALLNGGACLHARSYTSRARYSLMLALLNGGAKRQGSPCSHGTVLSDVSVTEWRRAAWEENPHSALDTVLSDVSVTEWRMREAALRRMAGEDGTL